MIITLAPKPWGKMTSNRAEWAQRRARDIVIAYQKTAVAHNYELPQLSVLEALIIQALTETTHSSAK